MKPASDQRPRAPAQPLRAVPAPVSRPKSQQAPTTAAGTAAKSAVIQPPQAKDQPSPEQHDVVEETLREAPPWLISMLIHLVLLLILALIASPAGSRVGRVLLTLGPADDPTDGEEFSEFMLEDPMDSMLDSLDDQMSDEAVEIPVPDIVESFETLEIEQIAPVEMPTFNSDLPIKPMVTGRSGAMKAALLAAYGGDASTVEAVDAGLAWLKRQQGRDGSWSLTGPYLDGSGSESKAAATAMALLAFQGDGNTHLAGPYAKEVERGMKWLIKQQNREGFFASDTRASHSKAYAQAQCTIAVSELYAMTQDSWLRQPTELAIQYAERAQTSGGWRYQPGNGADTSVTGWFLMALESARSGGIEVDPQVFYKLSEFLDRVQSEDGAMYTYMFNGRPTETMTAEGLLCRQYLGWQRDYTPMAAGVNFLVDKHNFELNQRNFYYWYYATQVLHHYGGSQWQAWNSNMKAQLPPAQVKSGREAGSWSPQGSRWGPSGGRLYATCLAIYCLEVYYRHLPLYAFGNDANLASDARVSGLVDE